MYRHKKNQHHKHHNHKLSNDHEEEYGAEFYPTNDIYYTDSKSNSYISRLVLGYVALFFSLFSLFLMPVVFGLIGIVLGIYTVTKGHSTLGYTSIGFGLFSVIVSIFYNLLFVLSAIL